MSASTTTWESILHEWQSNGHHNTVYVATVDILTGDTNAAAKTFHEYVYYLCLSVCLYALSLFMVWNECNDDMIGMHGCTSTVQQQPAHHFHPPQLHGLVSFLLEVEGIMHHCLIRICVWMF
jgi:hypothetical protein